MTLSNFAATFLLEAEDLLRQVESAALELESEPTNLDLVNRLFRAFHTIKGSGAMFGFNAVVSFTHHVETALDHVREGRLPASATLVSLVLAAKDHIQALLEVEALDSVPADPAGDALAARFAALHRSRSRPSVAAAAAHAHAASSDGQPGERDEPGRDPATAGSGTTRETYRVCFELQPSVLSIGVDPGCIVRELRELGPCVFHEGDADPPPASELSPGAGLRWDLTLTTDKPVEAIRDAFIFVEDLATIRIDRVEPSALSAPAKVVPATVAAAVAAAALVRPASVAPVVSPPPIASSTVASSTASPVASGVSGAEPERPRGAAETPAPGAAKRAAAQQSTVRVPSERLDQLVSLVGELVINQSRLTQAFAAGGATDMAGAVESMDRLIAELRDSVLGIRMMPIGSTFSRFQRLVRDLSSELGKEVDFVTEGGDTELDKTVIDRLGDPLVHLIRNSMDHGLELPEERVQKGKPSRGRLILSAAHEGANVVITLRDDGRGLNTTALRAKAEAKGLISPDAHLTEHETFDLVFLPGLSTARAVTNLSGRGVGLDVVKRTIDDLRGSIRLSSVPGQGITTRLTLPLTLAIVDGLLVEVDADRFIIPMASVLENVELPHAERRSKNGRNLVNVRGELVPYVRLRELFDARGPELALEKIVIVAVNGQRLGLVVDHVLGSHQTVIQGLGPFYRNVELFSGTTIMGDGRVAIIVDLAGIVRHVERTAPPRSLAANEPPPARAAQAIA